ncbi:hypothetical protein D6D15_07245 [Aureobasidium pullulans]|uniref:Uncharacterized protein n=1 Tax=Aureobasidium pullulans TaxID=5580 RepID=A0A4S9B1T1_AURPU|nr:hypothetical protein D6D15_07245 [Aureobasidium pullulans]
MKNLSTTKALERLLWTSLQPSLAPWTRSNTVDFHNKHLLLSNVLEATDVPGIVDFHIKDDAPLISPCPPCLEWTIWEINHEDMSERYKLIWDQMLTSKAVDGILIKFVQREGVEQSPLPHTIAITRSENGLHARFQNIHEKHISFIGHMNIFHRLYSLEMEDCSICDYDLEPMLTNPNLKHLRLHDVDLSPYTGNYRAHLPDRWPKMLGLVASTTDLQSCQISGLAD